MILTFGINCLTVYKSRRGLVGSVLAYYTKSQGSSLRPDIKTKYEKYFFSDFLSQQISGKNSESK